MTHCPYEVRDTDGTVVAYSPTARGATLARAALTVEMRRPKIGRGSLTLAYPPDERFPLAGGGFATATDLGLPTTED
jgi:hypothetical protein